MSGGESFDCLPVFCNRGRLIIATDQLHNSGEMDINLKFCIVHIQRIVKKRFGFNTTRSTGLIWAVQASDTPARCELALATVGEHLGAECEAYTRGIEPVWWVVFANTARFGSLCGSSRPVPLFDWRSSNFVESGNYALVANGLRLANPAGMLRLAAERFMTAAHIHYKNLTQW